MTYSITMTQESTDNMRRTIFGTDKEGNTVVLGDIDEDGTMHEVDENGNTRYVGKIEKEEKE